MREGIDDHASPAQRDRSDAPHARPHRRRSLWLLAAAALVLIVLLFMFLKGRGAEQQATAGPPPSVVNAAEARSANWSEQLTAVGSLRAIQGVEVTTEVPGVVQEIRFENGESAQQGKVLVQLDASSERAQLRALEAQREQARLAHARAQRLIRRGAIAQAELEAAKASFENLTAQVEQTRTLIAKKRIDAPFAGELGIREVNLGQYVGPGAPVVSLQQIAPIYVDFELPEAAVAKVRAGQPVAVRVEAYGERTFKGTIRAMDPDIDTNTRSIAVQAEIANDDRMLRPGMFADVTVQLPGTRTVTVVPANAITRNAYGDAVYLVARPDRKQAQQAQQAKEREGGFFRKLLGGSGQSDGHVQGKYGEEGGQQPQHVAKTAFVKTGERRGLQVEILDGVEPGQLVVTAGQVKLDDGAPLIITQRSALRDLPEQPRQP